MVEGGHYTLGPVAEREGGGERDGVEVVDVPTVGSWCARTSETTQLCFALAAAEVHRLRAAGRAADVGVMVGDLAIPAGTRQPGGAWALPPSYLAILRDNELSPDDVVVWGEAYARNQGKRRLLDEARARHPSAAATYAAFGWALLHDAEGIRLASDASLEWDGDVRTATLTRGAAPLCPLVFAGLKRAIFNSGYARHIAIYARADDAWIDAKLRAAAVTVAQLRPGGAGEQIDWIVLTPGNAPAENTWCPADLVAPGERAWSEFLAAVAHHHPGTSELETPCPTATNSPPSTCGVTKTTSLCSG